MSLRYAAEGGWTVEAVHLAHAVRSDPEAHAGGYLPGPVNGWQWRVRHCGAHVGHATTPDGLKAILGRHYPSLREVTEN